MAIVCMESEKHRMRKRKKSFIQMESNESFFLSFFLGKNFLSSLTHTHTQIHKIHRPLLFDYSFSVNGYRMMMEFYNKQQQQQVHQTKFFCQVFFVVVVVVAVITQLRLEIVTKNVTYQYLIYLLYQKLNEKRKKISFFLYESINWIVINVCRSRNRFFNDDPVYCLPLVVVVVVIVAGTFLLTCQCCCCPKVVNWIVLGLHFYLFIFDQILSIHDWNQIKKKIECSDFDGSILRDQLVVVRVDFFFSVFFLWLFCIVSVCSFFFIIYEFWLFLWISNIQNKCDQKD